jgi:hypothetical protein
MISRQRYLCHGKETEYAFGVKYRQLTKYTALIDITATKAISTGRHQQDVEPLSGKSQPRVCSDSSQTM